MKKWSDIPEFVELTEKIAQDDVKLQAEQRAKGVRLEFDPVIEKAHREWWNKLVLFRENYKKEHPEEFDENGKFKQDS